MDVKSYSLLDNFYRFPIVCQVYENLLSPEECDKWILDSENIGYEKACITNTNGEQVMNIQQRDCMRCYIDNDNEKLDLLWDRINKIGIPKDDMYGTPVCLNSRLRFIKYLKSNYFKKHYDGNCEVDDKVSYYTLQVYLNEDFSGGNLIFYNDECTLKQEYKPKKGSVIIFDQELLHEGDELVDGVKYCVRTDIMFNNDK